MTIPGKKLSASPVPDKPLDLAQILAWLKAEGWSVT